MFVLVYENSSYQETHVVKSLVFQRIRKEVVNLNKATKFPGFVFLDIVRLMNIICRVKIKDVGVHHQHNSSSGKLHVYFKITLLPIFYFNLFVKAVYLTSKIA